MTTDGTEEPLEQQPEPENPGVGSRVASNVASHVGNQVASQVASRVVSGAIGAGAGAMAGTAAASTLASGPATIPIDSKQVATAENVAKEEMLKLLPEDYKIAEKVDGVNVVWHLHKLVASESDPIFISMLGGKKASHSDDDDKLRSWMKWGLGIVLTCAVLAVGAVVAANGGIFAVQKKLGSEEERQKLIQETIDQMKENAKSEAEDAVKDEIKGNGSTADTNAAGGLAMNGSGGARPSGSSGGGGPSSSAASSNQVDPAVAQATRESLAMGDKPSPITDPSIRLMPDAETKRLLDERKQQDEEIKQLLREKQASTEAAQEQKDEAQLQKDQNSQRLAELQANQQNRLAQAQAIQNSNAAYLARFDSQRNAARSSSGSLTGEGEGSRGSSGGGGSGGGSSGGGTSGGGSGGVPGMSIPTNASQTASSLAGLAQQLTGLQNAFDATVATPISPK